MDSSSSLHSFQLGKLVLSSGLLKNSWSKISKIHIKNNPNQASGLRIKIYKEAKYTLVVFVAPRTDKYCSGSTLLSGSEDQNPFHFLCSEKISSFSLHKIAFQLFASAYSSNLSELKSKLLESKKSVILTGAGLGGNVASLFTLWLLETIDPKLKRPLCITFGSPLIVDADLQQILQNSVRNSCFLHVAMAAETPSNADFKPFGTFLICFDSECICIEDPEAIMELLTGDNTDPAELRDYGEILQRLDQSSMVDSGLMIDDIMERMEERAANKRVKFDQLKKLNDMKILMVYMEWYKKDIIMEKIGYYDYFKTVISSPVNIVVQRQKKQLNDFWISMVEENEKMPQTEKSILKTLCLLAGNNYRRLIEPLDIAEHYRDSDLNSPTEYRRSRHYEMLEKWFQAENEQPFRCKDRDLRDLLMFDSCFWAKVEKSLIVLNQLRTTDGMTHNERKRLMEKLATFEKHVWKMIGKREVSPEIFRERSSFMRWWKEYKEIKGLDSSPSDFTVFMNTRKYESYGQSIMN